MKVPCNYSVELTGLWWEKQHRKLAWVLEKTSFSFICGIFSITELDMIYFLREIFPP